LFQSLAIFAKNLLGAIPAEAVKSKVINILFLMSAAIKAASPLKSKQSLTSRKASSKDKGSIKDAVCGVNYIFHAAALKQVPSCEFYPMQALQTNVIGTANIIDAAIAEGVKKVIVLSTDKAVYPINAMGVSKAMMEKVTIAKSRNLEDGKTIICCTRYGNVMASRGSVIPLFIDQIRQGKDITITDPNMTRFMMSLDEAVELVLFAFENAQNGDIFVQKSPAATVEVLANTLIKLLNKPDHAIKIIGTRHGEKLDETLLTREENSQAGNQSFVDKKEGFYAHSMFALTNGSESSPIKPLRMKNSWTIENIKTRQFEMAEIAVKVWKI